MSDQVISLSSSDEEDNDAPPPKKRKLLPEPECTVTVSLVSTKPLESAINAKTIETVSLDSDDEVSENKNDSVKKTATNSVDSVEKPVKSTENVDLISLTDDEEDIIQPKVNKMNGVNNSILKSKVEPKVPKKSFVENTEETVSIIDDSDTEVEANEVINDSSGDKEEVNIAKPEKSKEKHDSIIIDDSDDETEKENHCENEPNETFPVHIEKTSANDIAFASTSKLNIKHLQGHKSHLTNSQQEASWVVTKHFRGSEDELEEAKALFKKFIRIIEEKIVDSSFEEILPKKVPIIQKYFNRSGVYVNDRAFKTLLRESIEGVRKSSTANGANSAVLAFYKVFEQLKAHMAETIITVDEDNLPKIKKLEKTINLLRKRIHQLEIAEVEFDDDEDSAYIMLDRYQTRLNKVYIKYCQYINRNPYSGRATYDRISFVNSKYNEINQALTRKYKNSLVFPSYFELENYITKVSKKDKLDLSEAEIKIESKKCFKVLGRILQKKRRQELYDSHLDFVESSEDPAIKDISLENVLKKNFVEGKEKIEKLYQKYVNKQEKGEDHVSTDAEQSSEDSTNEDYKDKKGKVQKPNNGKINIKRKGGKEEKGEGKKKKEEKEINKNEGEDVHNNNVDVKEEKENEEVENADPKNQILKEEIEKVNEENKPNEPEETPDSKEEITKEKQNDQQGNNIEIIQNIENTVNVEKDEIETQEEFLSVLNMQKQQPKMPAENIGTTE